MVPYQWQENFTEPLFLNGLWGRASVVWMTLLNKKNTDGESAGVPILIALNAAAGIHAFNKAAPQIAPRHCAAI